MAEGGVHFAVKIQTAEDIWHLYNLVENNDDLRAPTTRKITKDTASGAVSEKRHMTLTLHVTNVHYDNAGGFLRVSGNNRTVSDWVPQNAQHTIQIGYDPPVDVGITKSTWDTVHEERLALACDDSATAEVAAVLCGPGQANYFLVNGSMTSLKARLRITISKKKKASGTARDESLQKYYSQLLDLIVSNTNLNAVKVILLGAPPNLKDEFFTYFSNRAQRDDCPPPIKTLWQQKTKIVAVPVSSTMSLREVMADPSVQEKLALTAHNEDVRLWEEFNTYLNTGQDSKITYGIQCVFAAHKDHHAIEKLLVSDEAVRGADSQQRNFLTEMIDEVRELGGSSYVFSSRHYVGEQLKDMGGVAAILRIPLENLEDKIEVDPEFVHSKPVADYLQFRADQRKMAARASSSG